MSSLNCLYRCVALLPALKAEGAQNALRPDWQERLKMAVSWEDHLVVKTKYVGNGAGILTGMQINHR